MPLSRKRERGFFYPGNARALEKGLDVEAPFLAHVLHQGRPEEIVSFADIRQRIHHASFHPLVAANIDMGCRIGEQFGEIRRPFALPLLQT